MTVVIELDAFPAPLTIDLVAVSVDKGHYYPIALIDGIAAGAMLTMIAETMLPEAFHMGGSVTGLSAPAGFLATLLFKVIGT